MNQPKLLPFKFCPFCGDKRIEPNIDEPHDESRYHCPNCHNIHFRNSKPSVCAVIVGTKGILLVSGSSENNSLWDFPGGFLNYGEKPEDGLRRELLEELGVEVEAMKLFAAKIDTYLSDSDFCLNLFYATKLKSESFTYGKEINEPKWFKFDELPDIKFKSTEDVILSIPKQLSQFLMIFHDGFGKD